MRTKRASGGERIARQPPHRAGAAGAPRILAIALAVAAVFAAGQTVAGADAPARARRSTQVLRIADGGLRDIVDQGLARSWTLRELESRLASSPVVVYLARAPLGRGLAGRTRLIGAGEGWRFLLVELADRIDGVDLLSVVGHELQHAIEIADDEAVLDVKSLEALYRRIGFEARDGNPHTNSFETLEAIDAGRRVQAELLGLG